MLEPQQQAGEDGRMLGPSRARDAENWSRDWKPSLQGLGTETAQPRKLRADRELAWLWTTCVSTLRKDLEESASSAFVALPLQGCRESIPAVPALLVCPLLLSPSGQGTVCSFHMGRCTRAFLSQARIESNPAKLCSGPGNHWYVHRHSIS